MTEQKNSERGWVWTIAIGGVVLSLILACFVGAFAGFFAGKWAARSTIATSPWESMPHHLEIHPIPDMPRPELQPEMPQRPERFQFRVQSGAVINEVIEGSPADEAGLLPGDVILAVDGQRLTEDFTLYEAISQYEPGDWVQFQLWSHGRRDEVEVRLGENPDDPDRGWLGVFFTMMDIPDAMERFKGSD